MEDYKRGSHTVWDCKYHLVWTTKYRYQVLGGDVGYRCRELLRAIARSKEMLERAEKDKKEANENLDRLTKKLKEKNRDKDGLEGKYREAKEKLNTEANSEELKKSREVG